MPEDMMSQALAQLVAAYGPPGLVIGALLWVIKYLLDDRKELIAANKIEIAAERATNANLQKELLEEARKGAELAESQQNLLEQIAASVVVKK